MIIWPNSGLVTWVPDRTEMYRALRPGAGVARGVAGGQGGGGRGARADPGTAVQVDPGSTALAFISCSWVMHAWFHLLKLLLLNQFQSSLKVAPLHPA
jgi:hypothetical protein